MPRPIIDKTNMVEDAQIIDIPSWATKLSLNYRGNVLLMTDTLDYTKELVVSTGPNGKVNLELI